MLRNGFVHMFLWLGLWLLQCTNPFDTRTPEPPNLNSGQPLSDNTLQTDPNRILEKIRQSFELKDVRAYRAGFADEALSGVRFVFIPEDGEMHRLSDWRLEDEENYFNNLVSDNQVTIAFTPEQPVPTPVSNSPDTLQLDFEYRITTNQFRTNSRRYQGRSIMRIFRTSEELWYIFRWQDLRSGDTESADSTWSTLKANYRFSG